MSSRDDITSGRRLTRLPKTKFSGLDFDNIIEDITQLVTENPEYNKNWEDFLSSNAGRMLIEFFAYITDQLATRIDWVVNENFIGTATQRNSIIRLLKLIGYNLSLPKAASVPVKMLFDRPAGSKTVSAIYNFSSSAGATLDIFSLTAIGRNGTERKNFELIEYDQITNRFEYINNEITVNTGTFENPAGLEQTFIFHEGKTFIEEQEVTFSNNFSFIVNNSPVIENSIRVYRVTSTQDIELLRVESFLNPAAQRSVDSLGRENEIPYILNVLEGDRVSIEFGPTSLLPDSQRRPEKGTIIRVFYRVGGGEDGNIVRGAINTSRRELGGTGFLFWDRNVNINYVNDIPGSGGEAGEDPQYASVFGPMQIRTVQKAVTEEDYDILLAANTEILKTKSYGNNNIPMGLFNVYGLFVKPLEVWNFVILDKPGWKDVAPSKYNEFEWVSLRQENRFNEIVAFSDGEFNVLNNIFSNQITYEEEVQVSEVESISAKNFLMLNTSNTFKNNIFLNGDINPEFRTKLTTKIINENYFFLTHENNFLSEGFEISNKGEIKPFEEISSVYSEENAHYVSHIDIADNVDMTINKNIKISIDNREPIEIDLSAGAVGLENVNEEEIIDNINTALIASAGYNNTEAGTIKGEQFLGFTIANVEDRESGFQRNVNYYFKINGFEYFINSGDDNNGPKYSEIIDEINKNIGIKLKVRLINGSTTVEVLDGFRYLSYLKKGSVLSSSETEETTILNNAVVESVNWKERKIILTANATVNSPSHEITARNFIASFDTNDIKITNTTEEPVSPVWIQDGQRESGANLFSTLGLTLPPPTNSSGVPGYHKLGINGAINVTRGFHAFVGTFTQTTGGRLFKLTIDGGVPIDNIEITIDGISTLNQMRDALINELVITRSLDVTVVNDFAGLRIISNITGSSSSILIEDHSGPGQSLLAFLGGVRSPIQGEDAGVLGVTAGTYSFKVNNYVYEITLTGSETYLNLIDELNSILDYYTVSLEAEEWFDEIRVENDLSEKVYFEDIDFFKELSVVRLSVDGDHTSDLTTWDSFGDIIGGGNYSNVASVFNVLQEEVGSLSYIYLKSPCKGIHSSQITFFEPSTNNITNLVFGLSITSGAEFSNYGYKRISLILKDGDDFGKLLVENGSLNFYGDLNQQFYYHYIYDTRQMVELGTFNSKNFDTTDPEYREPANRIYNTVYNENTKEIDYFLSNFLVKFTKNSTDEMSLYSFSSDWDGLSSLEAAEIESVQNANTVLVGSGKYLLNINIDGVHDLEIDITGDEGGSVEYNIVDIIENINQAFRESDYYNFGNYRFFNFASSSAIGSRIVLRSPINSEDSSITFKEPSIPESDAMNILFGFQEFSGYEHVVIASGDYYIAENRVGFTGNITINSRWITGISNEIIDWVEPGFKVYEKVGYVLLCYVMEVDEANNRIKISFPALDTVSATSLELSNNLMILHRLNSEENRIPDLDFYVHFINDKRYKEEIFDGRYLQDEETGNRIKTPGYAFGELDEDRLVNYMNDKKIVAVDNIFKETKFNTFDVAGTIYYQSVFSREDVRRRVEGSLREAYRLEKRDFGEGVARSKIMSIIHENFGVEYVEINYLGLDATKPETSVQNTLNARFDEILVLSENILFGGQIIHGLIFNYVIAGV